MKPTETAIATDNGIDNPKAEDFQGEVLQAGAPPGTRPLGWSGRIRALNAQTASVAAVCHVIAMASEDGLRPSGDTEYNTRITGVDGEPHYFHAHVAAGASRQSPPSARGTDYKARKRLLQNEGKRRPVTRAKQQAGRPMPGANRAKNAARETGGDDYQVKLISQSSGSGGEVPLDWTLHVTAADNADAAVTEAIESFRALMPGLSGPPGENVRYTLDVVRVPTGGREPEGWSMEVSYTRGSGERPTPPLSELVH